jgi:Flp pilus assembly protein TadD
MKRSSLTIAMALLCVGCAGTRGEPLGSVRGLGRGSVELAGRAGAAVRKGVASVVARARPASSLAGAPGRGAEKPPSFSQLLLDGDRFRDSGDVSRAALTYFRALREDPQNRAPRERIGFMLLVRKDPERARASFQAALAGDPGSSLGHAGLGLAQLELGELDAAEASLRRASELDASFLLPLLALGVLSDERESYAAAQEYYARALALAPQSSDIENNLGVSLLMSGRFAEAVEHLTQATRLDPGNAAAQNNLGLALGRLGRYDEALIAFRNQGNEAVAQNNMGYVYLMNELHGSAIQCFELALESDPQDKRAIIRNLKRAEAATGLESAISAVAR